MRVYGDGPENLLGAREIGLADPERGGDDPAPQHHEIEGGGTGRGGEVRLRLAGIADRAAAARLEGRLVTVPAGDLPRLPQGDFYWHELVGCEVRLDEGTALGQVREIWDTGAHDVLVVQDARGRKHLIPTAREFVTDIDTAARTITVSSRPGLVTAD